MRHQRCTLFTSVEPQNGAGVQLYHRAFATEMPVHAHARLYDTWLGRRVRLLDVGQLRHRLYPRDSLLERIQQKIPANAKAFHLTIIAAVVMHHH